MESKLEVAVVYGFPRMESTEGMQTINNYNFVTKIVTIFDEILWYKMKCGDIRTKNEGFRKANNIIT